MGSNFSLKNENLYRKDENETKSAIESKLEKHMIESIVSDLIEEAYLEAKRIVMQRIRAIEKVASLLVIDPDSMLNGKVLLSLLRGEKITDLDSQIEILIEEKRERRMRMNSITKFYFSKEAVANAIPKTFRVLCGEVFKFGYFWNSNSILHRKYLTESNFVKSEISPFPPKPSKFSN